MEFVLASHGRDKDSSGPLICLWGDLAGHCLILVKYPTGDDAMHQHQLGQVFGVPAANKVQQMHRYDRNCLSVWKIARNLKLATRLKLLRPVSNCKHLGLRSCCTVFGPSPAVRSFYLNIFHLHGQGGSGRLWNRNGYHVVVYDRSMKMDGTCAIMRCGTDGNWKM